MKIGIDIDGTITCPSNVSDIINLEYKNNFKLEYIVEYSIGNVLNIPEEEVHRLFKKYRSHLFDTPKLNGISSNVINYWYDIGYEIILITARNESTTKDTKKWLSKCGIKYHKLYSIGSYGKSPIVVEEGIDVFIEDRIETIKEVEVYSPTTINILFDTPYNQGELERQSLRVFSWEEIKDNVEKLNKG